MLCRKFILAFWRLFFSFILKRAARIISVAEKNSYHNMIHSQWQLNDFCGTQSHRTWRLRFMQLLFLGELLTNVDFAHEWSISCGLQNIDHFHKRFLPILIELHRKFPSHIFWLKLSFWLRPCSARHTSWYPSKKLPIIVESENGSDRSLHCTSMLLSRHNSISEIECRRDRRPIWMRLY